MTKPFALDADGAVSVVGPPGLRCLLEATVDERGEESDVGPAETDDANDDD